MTGCSWPGSSNPRAGRGLWLIQCPRNKPCCSHSAHHSVHTACGAARKKPPKAPPTPKSCDRPGGPISLLHTTAKEVSCNARTAATRAYSCLSSWLLLSPLALLLLLLHDAGSARLALLLLLLPADATTCTGLRPASFLHIYTPACAQQPALNNQTSVTKCGEAATRLDSRLWQNQLRAAATTRPLTTHTHAGARGWVSARHQACVGCSSMHRAPVKHYTCPATVWALHACRPDSTQGQTNIALSQPMQSAPVRAWMHAHTAQDQPLCRCNP